MNTILTFLAGSLTTFVSIFGVKFISGGKFTAQAAEQAALEAAVETVEGKLVPVANNVVNITTH